MKSKSFDVAGKLESDLESTDAAVEVVCALQLPWKVLPISTTTLVTQPQQWTSRDHCALMQSPIDKA